MGYWKASSIEQTPELELIDWMICEVSSSLWEGRSRHFIGYNITEREGRVSSEIIVFDKDDMTGRTRSGRVYKLIGEPGFNSDGLYVWEMWCVRNECFDIEDVSGDFYDRNI